MRNSSGIQAMYVDDGIGNPVGLLTDFNTTAYAYTYDPYGAPVLTSTSGGNGTAQNPFTFKGGIQDRSTGFVEFGGRWYDPATGRFTQQDTLDVPLDPANRYANAADDPINNIDPTGDDSVCYLTPGNDNCGSEGQDVTPATVLYGENAICGGFGIALLLVTFPESAPFGVGCAVAGATDPGLLF